MPERQSKVVDEDMSMASLLEYFACVPDPRVARSQLHPLASVLVLSLCAVICGANSFVGIACFGNAREAWLRTFLDLPNGIPSHDTLGRIFAMLDPKGLEKAFRAWVAAIATLTKGEVIAIDGKTLRRSFRKAGSGAFVHMVSAWAAGNQLVLGQVSTVVPWHNNHSEGDIRDIARYRAVSGGTRSDDGSKNLGHWMSITQTRRKNRLPLGPFVVGVYNAHLHGTSPPSVFA
jgi:hypothetical protein